MGPLKGAPEPDVGELLAAAASAGAANSAASSARFGSRDRHGRQASEVDNVSDADKVLRRLLPVR
jgi:hypothetical protein